MAKDEDVLLTSKSKDQKLKEREEKRAKVSKSYYQVPEETMQEMIARAQAGSSKDSAELLNIFSNFIEKYVNLLFHQRYDLRDYDTRQFINLYIGDPLLRAKIKRDGLTYGSYKEINQILGGIFFMVQRYGTVDDVRQTVQMTFLDCVRLYKRRGSVPFSGFIYRYFFYKLQKDVNTFLIGQLGMKTHPLVLEGDPELEGIEVITEKQIPHEMDAEKMLAYEEIDEFWVSGDSCGFPFNFLSHSERQLLKWRYIDNLRPNKISLKTADHPNTVRQQLNLIGEKIQALIEEDLEILSS